MRVGKIGGKCDKCHLLGPRRVKRVEKGVRLAIDLRIWSGLSHPLEPDSPERHFSTTNALAQGEIAKIHRLVIITSWMVGCGRRVKVCIITIGKPMPKM